MIRIMKCSICSDMKRENLILFDKNICNDCEEKMIKANYDDIMYQLYMDRIKHIWETKELGLKDR
jgi:hypothetical protein